MNENKLLQYRLINQQLLRPKFKDPKDLVGWLGAIQAQDYSMAKWGIGVRLKNTSDELIENAINNGDIIRTHIMRPTWHFVSADDIRWMIELTAPHINRATTSMYRLLELDESVFKKSNPIIQRALAGNNHLTREELMKEVSKAGIKINSLRAIHIMFRAELDALVCNGIKRNKQFTYALFDERVPMTKKLLREEALVKLAAKYFTSHAPATVQDFAWWSGLPAADARLGLELNKSNLISEKINGDTYWMSNTHRVNTNLKTVHLLPSYDEFTISYKNRSASLDSSVARKVVTTNGIFNPIILVNGKVIGTWKRTVKKTEVIIELSTFTKIRNPLLNEITSIAIGYGKFLGLVVNLKK